MKKTITLVLSFFLLVSSAALLLPPYSGTIFIESDIVNGSDPSTFVSSTYTGQGNRTVFDRRVNAWITINAYLFNIVWDDGLTSEAQVNPEFGFSAAAVEAEKYGWLVGQLPTCLRLDVDAIWIHAGTQPFGGGNNSILIHTGQSTVYESSGILEETLIHEACHTSLDAYHATSSGWVAAQGADGDYISTYAQGNPFREDIAESFLPWVGVRLRSDRISQQNYDIITQTIPNRLAYFDNIVCDMYPITGGNLGDYDLAVNAYSGSCDPDGKVYTINVVSVEGYSDEVSLSVSGLPAGISGNFSTNPVIPGNSSTLTLSGNVSPGIYVFDVLGNSTSGQKTLSLELEVYESVPGTVVLNTPVNGAEDVSPTETLTWQTAGSGAIYTLEVATDPSFSNIITTATNLTTNTYQVSGLVPGTLYYWRVVASNSCGMGAYSTTFSFRTSLCFTINSPNVPVGISTIVETVTSTLSVSNLNTITDVNIVTMQGSHSYIWDLIVDLTSPAGTTVNLWTKVCAGEDNFNIQFDDAATNPYSALPCPPVDGGNYQPNGSLAAFNGEDPNGTWTLTIQDTYENDGGSLNAWAIEICTEPIPINCTENMVISDTYNNETVLREVSNNITATEIITGTADVKYSAGVDIDLLPGFSVDAGAQFHAYILGCGTAAAVGYPTEKMMGKDKE